jgi:pimeloyl-ACP methyl ester carboxylesterase
MRPDGAASGAAVLILPGSGPTDRNGNQPALYNDSLKKVAEGLAGCGIASLRIDKRGVGASREAGFDEGEIHFDDYVTDAARWLAWLRGQPGVTAVNAIGHSEGALLATLAASKAQIAHIVLIAGAGRPGSAVLRGQMQNMALAPAGQRRAMQIIALLEAGEFAQDVPPALGNLFRGSVQGYLIDWFRHDPAADLARTTMPALVVQGGTDVQVGLADAQRLVASRRGVELAVFPSMNHVLRAAPAEWAGNLATYSRADLPLAPGLVDRVCRFLRG